MIPKHCSTEQLCGKLSAHCVKNSMLVQGKLQLLHLKRCFWDLNPVLYVQMPNCDTQTEWIIAKICHVSSLLLIINVYTLCTHLENMKNGKIHVSN